MTLRDKVPLRERIEIFVQALRASAKVTKHKRVSAGTLRYGDVEQLKAFVAGEVEFSLNLMIAIIADDLEKLLEDEQEGG